MATYFINGNKFVPPKSDQDIPALDSITGVFEFCDTKEKNNGYGYWLVMHLKVLDEYFYVYCTLSNVNTETFEVLGKVHGKRIKLTCENGCPLVQTLDPDYEFRVTLLKGLASGNIKKEDLPALLAFAKGEDELFEQWSLFKKQLEAEGLEDVKNQISEAISKKQKEIERDKERLHKLHEIESTVNSEKDALLKELSTSLRLLEGEESLRGTCVYYGYGDTEQMIRIGNGYQNLISALSKAGTRKGIYVISGNKIHLIHYLFLENKGRAFLIGTDKEYLKTKPEKVKEIIDSIDKVQHR